MEKENKEMSSQRPAAATYPLSFSLFGLSFAPAPDMSEGSTKEVFTHLKGPRKRRR